MSIRIEIRTRNSKELVYILIALINHAFYNYEDTNLVWTLVILNILYFLTTLYWSSMICSVFGIDSRFI